MQISARNTFCGKVGAVLPGAVNDEIEIILSGGEKIIAIVTREASEIWAWRRAKKYTPSLKPAKSLS